jgi:hypothetical protein
MQTNSFSRLNSKQESQFYKWGIKKVSQNAMNTKSLVSLATDDQHQQNRQGRNEAHTKKS